MSSESQWKSYEDVARFLLNQVASHLGLASVEGKQTLVGSSGAKWEVDAKGVKIGDEGFVLVECRRYTKSRLAQEDLAGFAYRIKDTGGTGGITVSPLDLQTGAKVIAQAEHVTHVRLSPESTTAEYVMQFLNRAFVGIAATTTGTASLGIQVRRAQDKTEIPDDAEEQ